MLAYTSSGITSPRDQVKAHEVRAIPWSCNIIEFCIVSLSSSAQNRLSEIYEASTTKLFKY
jgi:hypothetical protein